MLYTALVWWVGCSIDVPSNVYLCDEGGRCPSPLVCAPPGTREVGYCVRAGRTTLSDAAPFDSFEAGLGVGADAGPTHPGPTDAGDDAAHTKPAPSLVDASEPTALDAALPVASDAASVVPPVVQPDASSGPAPDLTPPDAGPATVVDAGAPPEPPAVPDAGPPPVVVVDAGTPTPSSCVVWATTTTNGEVPAGAMPLATEQNEIPGALPFGAPADQPPPYVHQQFLCSRDRVAPGKWIRGYGCNSAVLRGGEWVADYASGSQTFSVLAPPAGCVLDFAIALPTGTVFGRPLAVAREPDGSPVYVCKAHYEEALDKKKGDHLGRVVQGRCLFEYYGERVVSVADHMVLVQVSP